MPPVAIAAGIAAVGTIGGALIGQHAQSQANQQAAQTQNNATAAQLQLGQESLAQNQAIYNSNYDTLSPWVSRGNVAGDSYNALLGLPAAPHMTSPLAAPAGAPAAGTPASAAPTAYSGPSLQQIAGMQNDGIPGNYQAAMQQYYAAHPSDLSALQHDGIPGNYAAATGQQSGGGGLLGGLMGAVSPLAGVLGIGGANTSISRYASPALALATSGGGTSAPATNQVVSQTPAAPPAAGGAPATAAPPANALSPQAAFNNFANSAGMQFQLQQGTNALNNLYAGRGMLQSGAAMKGINDYAQQTALQNYFMPYMNMVSGVSNQGLSAGSAIAGVGQNAANTAANINAGMGSAINSGAQNIGNLQLANGQNNANMWGRIGGALGGLGSSFFPTPTY